MTTMRKPTKGPTGKKEAASVAGRLPSTKQAQKSGFSAMAIELRQLQQADKMLTRIERKGEELSASADKLLRRVS
jgi:hypothetical protein